MTPETWRKAWDLLDARERWNAIRVLGVMMIGALASAAMVGSVFPFLAVLANPDLIRNSGNLRFLYDVGGFTSDYSFLVALGVASMVVILISNAILVVQAWAVARFSELRVHSISVRLLRHYLSQPYAFFLGRHSGDMSTNILAEVGQVVHQVLAPIANLLSGILTVLAVVATLVIADPWVALASIGAFAAIYSGIMILTRRRIRRLGQARTVANAARFRIAGEALGGIKDVKLLGREADYLARFAAPSEDSARSLVAISVTSQTPRFGIQVIAFGGIVLLCLLMMDPEGLEQREALGGILPLVGLLAFAGQRLMPEAQKIYSSIVQMTAGSAALDRIHADLGRAASAPPLDTVRPAPLGLNRDLRLEGVTFVYPGAERAGLRGVDLTIRAGERIGIVGASGAGKTTLADVILGLFPPAEGRLVADGTVIDADTLRAWQSTVGYVPQDIFLTDASLAENIALGLPPDEIERGQVERAARIARLHDFALSELPNGYDTRIGERGVRLSGGQRQRIGIARALYHDADLIVFDEATSALDNLTEREVMAAIDALPGDKTILLIAHRLSTVRRCDRIVVMEGGQVSAAGAWADLAETSPAFRRLVHHADVA